MKTYIEPKVRVCNILNNTILAGSPTPTSLNDGDKSAIGQEELSKGRGIFDYGSED